MKSELLIALEILIKQSGGAEKLALDIEKEWENKKLTKNFLWTPDRIQYLKKYYEVLTVAELAERLRTNKEAVKKKLYYLRKQRILPYSERSIYFHLN